jgi:hypothetical protein
MRCLFQLLLLLLPTTVLASPPPSPSLLCDTAIAGTERAARLPPRLLGAIADVESGRPDAAGNLHPWPWTINAEGRGQFFASKRDAVEAVRTLQAQGMRSINAAYAARFLNTLYGISGSWVKATAAYHSQTPAIGADYGQRVMARWQHRGPSTAVVQTAYSDFTPRSTAYGAFQPTDRVYGAFAEPAPMPTRLAHR